MVLKHIKKTDSNCVFQHGWIVSLCIFILE